MEGVNYHTKLPNLAKDEVRMATAIFVFPNLEKSFRSSSRKRNDTRSHCFGGFRAKAIRPWRF